MTESIFNIRPNKYDNRKIIVREAGVFGLGLFALDDITRGENIAWFDGPVFRAQKNSDLPYAPAYNVQERAIQNGKTSWLYASGFGLFINHSCQPNCGVGQTSIQHRGDLIVSIRDIKRNEHITFDYAMTENSDFRMECKCGSESCRKIIGAYNLLNEIQQEAIQQHVSPYLRSKPSSITL